ncbi:hypothetical protein L2E82_30849 [Cichorium intybus]|uniref:Uncharacterized protein n=1 Tax=Cichorium intybus TaxID=13427 RepID=A0ACB9D1V2_CICIN|nr:hypothetical protein L2E82_30849 [Cichorium intybus]
MLSPLKILDLRGIWPDKGDRLDKIFEDAWDYIEARCIPRVSYLLNVTLLLVSPFTKERIRIHDDAISLLHDVYNENYNGLRKLKDLYVL